MFFKWCVILSVALLRAPQPTAPSSCTNQITFVLCCMLTADDKSSKTSLDAEQGNSQRHIPQTVLEPVL